MDTLYFLMWGRKLLSGEFISALLDSFGILWLCVEVAAFFSDPTSQAIKSRWYVFLIGGIVYATMKCKPSLRVSCRLTNRDATIAVAIGNIFNFPGALVVGSNTTFDTDISRELISPASI